MTPTGLSIASQEALVSPYQVISPLGWRVAATLPRIHPSIAFLQVNILRDVPYETYKVEVSNLAKSIPKEEWFASESQQIANLSSKISKIAVSLSTRTISPAALFYLAFIGDESLFVDCFSKGYIPLFRSLSTEFKTKPELADRAIRVIVLACVRYDLENRYFVCRDDLLSLDVPCFFQSPSIRNWLIVFLGHFSRRWVSEFMKQMNLSHSPHILRLFQLVREDASIFANALSRIENESFINEYKFFETFRNETGGNHRQALAFLYRRPHLIWEAMQWSCSPSEVLKMKYLAGTKALSLTPTDAVEICFRLLI